MVLPRMLTVAVPLASPALVRSPSALLMGMLGSEPLMVSPKCTVCRLLIAVSDLLISSAPAGSDPDRLLDDVPSQADRDTVSTAKQAAAARARTVRRMANPERDSVKLLRDMRHGISARNVPNGRRSD